MYRLKTNLVGAELDSLIKDMEQYTHVRFQINFMKGCIIIKICVIIY